ncbi:dephospho-CoA kinase [Lusitaniella coriacea LEGE 07157]|uniref:Dephospho-CoA kinase n=1 Tax=Lusitaniella coriacea LEGE 07157 TaxID=945747 RepID=A0A8J7DNN5_9CYAN|nr:dephospho-CoA kinase [Lusitaniella coriacea]MBE9114909.1 dephospho-CoA kinase [Lusitaniella coriacea LEGE 07157]
MTANSPLKIGLTGGISTGKTTVSRYFAEAYQLPILDADVYAREAVQFGSRGLQAIAERYGRDILLPDGTLNRAGLGKIIFNDLGEKHWVEGLIHPFVRDRALTELERLDATIVVLAIPLLFEAKMTDLVDRVWVVSCSPQQQLKRLMARDRLFPQQAQARIDNQMPLEQKIALADRVLDNSSTVPALLKQVDRALQFIHNEQ